MIKEVEQHLPIDLEQLSDIFKVMRYQEETIYKKRDHLSNLNPYDNKSEGNMVNEVCREKMATWFFQVIECCNFSRITGNIAMSYLDRFLGTNQGGSTLYDRKEYKLAAMCCLELAVKIHEPQKIELKSLSELSQGEYSALELKRKEREILSALNWRMCSPTASCFVSYYLDLLPQTLPFAIKEQIRYLSNFQIESSIKYYCFLSVRPSEVALSSVLNAMALMQCSNISLSQSFHRNIILIAGKDPTNIMIHEIREKLRKPMEYSFSSLDKVLDQKNCAISRINYESHTIKISPNCIRNQQA